MAKPYSWRKDEASGLDVLAQHPLPPERPQKDADPGIRKRDESVFHVGKIVVAIIVLGFGSIFLAACAWVVTWIISGIRGLL